MNKIVSNKKILFCLKAISGIFIIGLVSYFSILVVFPFPYKAIKNIPYSMAVYDKDGRMLHEIGRAHV